MPIANLVVLEKEDLVPVPAAHLNSLYWLHLSNVALQKASSIDPIPAVDGTHPECDKSAHFRRFFLSVPQKQIRNKSGSGCHGKWGYAFRGQVACDDS